jgi:hypothetical protein
MVLVDVQQPFPLGIVLDLGGLARERAIREATIIARLRGGACELDAETRIAMNSPMWPPAQDAE